MSRSFSNENQDEYPQCGICEKTNHVKKYFQWREKPQR